MPERIVVCRADELPVGGRRLVHTPRGTIGVFNVNGRHRAVKNVCPHARAELCHGPLTGTTEVDDQGAVRWVRDGEILRCGWHGWEFDLDTGETLTTPRVRVATYPVHVEGEDVVLHV